MNLNEKIAEEQTARRAALSALTGPEANAVLYSIPLVAGWSTTLKDTPSAYWPGVNDIETVISGCVGGVTLTFTVNYLIREKRCAVRLTLPPGVKHGYVPRGESYPSATFAADRGIAGFSQAFRRLKDDAVKFVVATLAAKERDDAYLAKRSANVVRLASALGVSVPEIEPNSEARLRTQEVEVRVVGDNASIELSYLPIEVAEKVLKLIASESKRAKKRDA
jgi:hypothetical protein